ncbi:MAG: glycoside hydrolase family 92 protein [Novosphingobium sp.]|uniref:glycoside hydrolase domain-containing protein n=1 Tax=Novosphingobium sp. TaxID=1874826 RepID=UPI00273439E0|nr:glycoside hydrolase domain-containing protein [Novosphingobium sp.]MDP3551098.1 glycoside hydrolase family 92 protein [Novosphingobium sp.]
MSIPHKLARVATVAALTLANPAAARSEPGMLVNPFVGTLADFGQLSPAAVSPYGMVQLGPDTTPANHAGYDYAATTLDGFSHTRGVGVGCGGAGGDVRATLVYAGEPMAQQFDKRSERAHAGYYRVSYGPGIVAEMTSTRGGGALRFRVPRAGRLQLSVAFTRTYSKHIAAQWNAMTDGDLHASFSAGTVCDAGTYHLHSATRVLQNGRAVVARWDGDRTQLAMSMIEARAGDVVELRTGLSSIDPAAAANVREIEMGGQPFAEIARQTLNSWNHELSRVTISGTRDDRALFYTALFRVMQTPVAIADPDGRFRGSDGKVSQVRRDEQHYTNWAMWDNYRTQMPLIALIDPVRAEQIAKSLVRLYQTGKRRWATQTEPFLTVRTEHAGITLLDFYRKGITGFDVHSALQSMAAESATLARNTPDEQIEAAYDDWAIAELATELGQSDLALQHRQRSLAYRDMWLATFNTLGLDADVVKARGLYQGTIAQYRWAPVFDLPWLKATMGDRFDSELSAFFAKNLFNMTNQPDMHVPYILTWAGDRAATDAIVARYLTQPVAHRYTNSGIRPQPWMGRSFALSPQGFADGMDDDAGAMTGWYIWSVLGLYPLTPGQPEYVVARPQVRRAVVRPSRGLAVVIGRTAQGQLSVNGRALDSISLAHDTLAR